MNTGKTTTTIYKTNKNIKKIILYIIYMMCEYCNSNEYKNKDNYIVCLNCGVIQYYKYDYDINKQMLKKQDNEYYRKYYQINRNKLLEYKREYRIKNRNKMKNYMTIYMREYRIKNKNKLTEYIKIYMRSYRMKNKIFVNNII